jgi:flagellar hook assembly protein FlgD
LDGVWVRVATRSITVPATPVRLALTGASPNPFNPQTLIGFTVPRPQQVRLAIHDLAGRRIRTLVDTGLPAGERSLTWSGTDDTGRPVPSGTYLVRLTGADGHDVRKLTLTR